MDNVALPDFHDFINAIGFANPAPDILPSHVSFDVEWNGQGDRLKVRDTDWDFGGTFVSGDATVAFSASNDGKDVTYTSVAGGQHTVGAGVGHEQNGAFFV